jgi:hypothetical protein
MKATLVVAAATPIVIMRKAIGVVAVAAPVAPMGEDLTRIRLAQDSLQHQLDMPYWLHNKSRTRIRPG